MKHLITFQEIYLLFFCYIFNCVTNIFYQYSQIFKWFPDFNLSSCTSDNFLLEMLYWVIYKLILQNLFCNLRYISTTKTKLPAASVLHSKSFIKLIFCTAFRFASRVSCLLIYIAVEFLNGLRHIKIHKKYKVYIV